MPPTYQREPRFDRDLRNLTSDQRAQFRQAVEQFVTDLRAGQGFRPGLRVKRVKRVQGTADVWEVTFAPDGRATWQYGPEVRVGTPHVIWRRVGTHDVFRRPRSIRSPPTLPGHARTRRARRPRPAYRGQRTRGRLGLGATGGRPHG